MNVPILKALVEFIEGIFKHTAPTVVTAVEQAAAGAAVGGAAGAVLTGGSAIGTVGGAVIGGVIGDQVSPDDKKKK